MNTCSDNSQVGISYLLEKSDSIYRICNDRLHDLDDLLYYQQKYLVKFLSSRRRNNINDQAQNLTIILTWYLALCKRFHIDIEKQLLRRYPYKCPFCLSMPCNCEADAKKSRKTGRPTSIKPDTVGEWQDVIRKIYPNDIKLNHQLSDGLHELNFSFRKFRRNVGNASIKNVSIVATDFFVLIVRQFNILDIDIAKYFTKLFKNGCFVCKKLPCECYYTD